MRIAHSLCTRTLLVASAAMYTLAVSAPPVLAQDAAGDSAAVARLEARKLELEIEEMEREASALARVGGYVALLTPLLALLGFWFTVYQFAKNQEKDRAGRAQERRQRDETRLSTVVDELLSLNPEQQPAVGKISFLLAELKDLVERVPDTERRITDALSRFLHDDADFNQVRYVQLDLAALFEWPWYVARLKDEEDLNAFLTYRYIQAFHQLHKEDPSYFESVHVQPDGTYEVLHLTDEARYLRFEALMRGFVWHLRHTSNQALVNEFMDQFGVALKNQVLTAQIRSQVAEDAPA